MPAPAGAWGGHSAPFHLNRKERMALLLFTLACLFSFIALVKLWNAVDNADTQRPPNRYTHDDKDIPF